MHYFQDLVLGVLYFTLGLLLLDMLILEIASIYFYALPFEVGLGVLVSPRMSSRPSVIISFQKQILETKGRIFFLLHTQIYLLGV